MGTAVAVGVEVAVGLGVFVAVGTGVAGESVDVGDARGVSGAA